VTGLWFLYPVVAGGSRHHWVEIAVAFQDSVYRNYEVATLRRKADVKLCAPSRYPLHQIIDKDSSA
jgi:hypothetical protein